MDNLRGYGKDEPASSSGLGRSVAKLPSSSEGLLAPTSSQAPVMADSTPAITLVTSGPVPAVLAPTPPASSVPKDSAQALDDLPPPPPPAEPYEVFMARVQRDLSSLPVRSTQSGAAVPPRPAVATPTTGSRLPTPFPRFEDSSWALQPQAPNIRIRMPLPASCYVPPPSPWVWPGRGSSVDTTMVRGPPPATLPAGPPGPYGPSGLLAGPSAVGPSPVPPPTKPAADPKKTSPTPGSPAPSRCPSGANMTRRLAGRPSLSPRRRSSSHHRRSRRPSRGRQSSPPSRSRGPHRRMTSSSSRSPSPKRHRTASTSPWRHGSRSSSPERGSHPYDSDIRLLRLRADDDDQHPASTHPSDSPDPGQSTSVDGSQLSAEKVQKLFADLITPPALSHYADPIPDSASNKQLVPYVRTSASTASTIDNSEPLETHGLFQNYQSFHRLSGDTEKEACTAAYHDLTNLMLSQTEESLLINVSSSRPKTDEPFPCGLTTSNEMKKKHDKLHLQWPPQSVHHKVINHTLALYQHGPPPKSGTTDKWPPPPVQNPWDKTFVLKEFPTTHKIPSAMPKRWDLHASSPLMLRPPQSTAVPEVQDSEISKSSSWLEAFAARAAHTSTMSATSMVGVYNFQQKVLRFIRDSASKNNIHNDISLVDDLIQRANSMALEAHIMAHDSGVTATELFTHLHMLRRRSVLDSPTVALPQRDKERLLVMSVGGNDLFGPDARKVYEWKLDTEEENVKLIARVFDERAQHNKSKKKPSSSDSPPPWSVMHRSPLDALARPKPKDSYNQKPGQSFQRPPKQSPYKARTGTQQRSQTFSRDRPASSSNRTDSREQGQRRQDKEPKGPQSARPFNRKGRGVGRKRSRPQIGTNSFRLGGS